jgi:hypothetical protein
MVAIGPQSVIGLRDLGSTSALDSEDLQIEKIIRSTASDVRY